MKRIIHTAIPLLVGAFVGCASSSESMGPSKSLVRARQLQQEASQSRAREVAAADFKDAQRMLEGAEKEHARCASCNMEKHLAALAVEKFERAMAEARRHSADQRYVTARLEGAGQRVEEVASVHITEEGKVITLPGEVLFRSGESELLPNARDRLRVVARALREQTDEDFGILVEGHADARGTDEFNVALSKARAESVKQFLITEGVESDRIRTVARGEREPIATNETPEGRANNRRVEIKVPGEA